MEQLLHYVWKHRLFALQNLCTTDGEPLEVIDTGLHNTNAGPDFFNAKIKINDTVWVGNVEIHERSSQWYQHAHDKDERYNNVILHVVAQADKPVFSQDGKQLVQMELAVPQETHRHYTELIATDHFPPCYKIIPQLPRLMIHGWLTVLQTERLEQKTKTVLQRLEQYKGSWENALFVTLARNYGFGINGEAFEMWANHIPLHAIAHHRDNLFQIEALFLGQAGLLEEAFIPKRYLSKAHEEGYFDKLRNEYLYLARKFSLQPMNAHQWLFLRLRPQNFPYIRLSQLAQLYFSNKVKLANIIACENIEQLRETLATAVTPYWQTHYVFGEESKKSSKHLSTASINRLIVNTVIPILFAYGRYQGDDKLCDRALQLLEQLKTEDNRIIRMWKDCGLEVANASDSQALIQLKNEYCDKRECLRCRIGYEYLKGTYGVKVIQPKL